MAKQTKQRVSILLECSQCKTNTHQRIKGVSRYKTSKNRHNTSIKLELLKYCQFCNLHTRYKEIK